MHGFKRKEKKRKRSSHSKKSSKKYPKFYKKNRMMSRMVSVYSLCDVLFGLVSMACASVLQLEMLHL